MIAKSTKCNEESLIKWNIEKKYIQYCFKNRLNRLNPTNGRC